MEGKQNKGKPENYVTTDDSRSVDPLSTSYSPTMSDYHGSEHDPYGHDILETILNISTLLSLLL